MKLIFLTLICPLFMFSQSVMLQDNLDLLIEESKAIEGTKSAFGLLIEQQAAKTKNAPMNIVDLIQKKIDYEGYRQEIKNVFSSYYSSSQIDELLEIYRSGNMELYKQKTLPISEDLYKLGSEFGRNSMKIIVAELKKF